MPIQPQFGGPQNPRWCCMRKVFCMASFMQFHCVSTGVGVRGAGFEETTSFFLICLLILSNEGVLLTIHRHQQVLSNDLRAGYNTNKHTYMMSRECQCKQKNMAGSFQMHSVVPRPGQVTVHKHIGKLFRVNHVIGENPLRE